MPLYSTFEEFLVHSHANPNPQKLTRSPGAKLWFTPKKGVGFSLEPPLETSHAQTYGERTSLEPIQVDLGSPTEAGEGLGSRAGQENPITPFLVGTKIKPTIPSTSKQRPSTQIPTSTKRLTKTTAKGPSSKRPKR